MQVQCKEVQILPAFYNAGANPQAKHRPPAVKPPTMAKPSSKPFDVCIRGGGITGRVLALLLARERLRVALVLGPVGQGNVPGHGDVRAYALNQKSKTLLEDLRCWPAGISVTAVTSMQVQGDDGGAVGFTAWQAGVQALAWIADVPALEAQLAQATQFQPHITVVDAPVPATLTVVCEGRNSQTRTELGVDFDGQPYCHHAIATRVRCAAPHQGRAWQWFAGGPSAGEILALLPLDGPLGNLMAVVWSVTDEHAQRLMQQDAATFCAALQTASQDALGGLKLTAERSTWPLQLAQAQKWVGQMAPGAGLAEAGDAIQVGAWALAGDAAHTVHPLSGQGLNLGLADVAELAGLVAKRDYWRSVADLKLLRGYERSRKLDAALLATATDGLQRLFAQSGGNWQTLRNRGMQWFDSSGLIKNWVSQRAMGV